MEIILLFVLVIGLLLIGVPIAVSLGLCLDPVPAGYFRNTSLASVAQTLYQAMEGHYTLLAIPFFILASSFMSTGGVAQADHPFCHRLCRPSARRPGDCRGAGLHDVRRPFGVFARDRGGDRFHRHRGDAADGLFARTSPLA